MCVCVWPTNDDGFCSPILSGLQGRRKVLHRLPGAHAVHGAGLLADDLGAEHPGDHDADQPHGKRSGEFLGIARFISSARAPL